MGPPLLEPDEPVPEAVIPAVLTEESVVLIFEKSKVKLEYESCLGNEADKEFKFELGPELLEA
jgi:hypothetical protein